MAKLSLDSNTLNYTTTLVFKHTINTKKFPQFLDIPQEHAQSMLDGMTKHFFKAPLEAILNEINAGNEGTFVEVVL